MIKRWFWRIGVVSLLSFLFINIGLATPLPDLGDASQRALTPLQEKQLGQYFMFAIRRTKPISNDPIVNDYIENLGYRLVSYSPNPRKNFHFFVVQSNDINAFSGPAAYVGIDTGLIAATNSESELASVLAHEIAHVVQGHITRSYAEQKRLSIPTLAGLLAAIAIGLKDPEAGVGAATAVGAGASQHTLTYSRGYEREADRIGMDILAKAHFDPHSMPAFFRQLEKMNQLNSYGAPVFLQTHPMAESRLIDAENRADQYPAVHIKENPNFPLIQARAIVSMIRDLPKFIREYKVKLKNKPNSIKIRYAYALALLHNKKAKEAETVFNPLLKQLPDNLILHMTEAYLKQENKQQKAALKTIQKLYHDNPDYYPVIAEYAHILIQQKQEKKAVTVLKKCYDSQKMNTSYLLLLSHALGHSQQLADAYQIRARVYRLNGNVSGEMGQLNMALRYLKNDKATKQVIEARILQLQKRKKS